MLLLWGAVLSPTSGSMAGPVQIEMAEFRQVEHREDGSTESILTGKRAIVEGARVRIHDVALTLFGPDGVRRLRVATPLCVYSRDQGVARGDGPIHGSGPSLTLAGVGYVVNTEEQTLTIHSQVKMTMQTVPTKTHIAEDEE